MSLKQRPILRTSSVRSNADGSKCYLEDLGGQKELACPQQATNVQSVCSFSDEPCSPLPEPWGKKLVVVIPSYNCEKYLRDALKSLQQQTLPKEHWGVFVINDSSEDATDAVCRTFGAFMLRPRTNKGKAWGLNLASRLLDPDQVIVELDADDALTPNALEEVFIAWQQHPSAVIVYSNYKISTSTMEVIKNGHNRASGTSIEDAGWISHLKTYRVSALRATGGLDETIKKSIDKDLVYKLQEVAIRTGGEIFYVDKYLYIYRRRKEGSITWDRNLDATRARKNVVRRRFNIKDDAICVCSVGTSNDSGGPGIFWARLMAELGKREEFFFVEDARNSDVVIGNVRIAPEVNHERPWVVREDGVYFNSRDDYKRRNENIAKCLVNSEGVIYQTGWGKQMMDEYCGRARGKFATIINGVDPPTWFKKNPSPKKIVTCARWGTNPHRYFKRLEAGVGGFVDSGIQSMGYEMIVLGETSEMPFKNAPGVTYAGRVPVDDVWKTLQDAALLLHLSWFDCCPNSVLEALATQTPVVCCADGVRSMAETLCPNTETMPFIFVPDNPVNHPCDITKPPALNKSAVVDAINDALIMHAEGKLVFPDVSIARCVDQYAAFIKAVATEPLLPTSSCSNSNLKRVSVTTEEIV